MEVGERVSNVVEKGYAAWSEGKKGVPELKAAEKDEVLDTDHLPENCPPSNYLNKDLMLSSNNEVKKGDVLCSNNEVKKGDLASSIDVIKKGFFCDGRSYASVVASNRPPPASPRTRQTKTPPKPRSSSEQPKKPKFLIKMKTVNLRGQRVEEGIVMVKDYIIFGMKYNFLNFLQLITDVYELDRTGHPTDRPSKLRKAIISLLKKQGFQWDEDRDNLGNILITFDGLPKKGIENEKPSWVKKAEERKKRCHADVEGMEKELPSRGSALCG